MNHLKGIVLFSFVAVLAIGYLLLPSHVSAEGSAALGWPPRKDYTVEPGKTVNDTLTIRNTDREKPLKLALSVVDFTFKDDGGTPELMLAKDAPQTPWSLKTFLEVPKTVTIDPGASETLDMSVSVPEGHGAGSFYSAIVFSTGDPGEGGNVGLNASGVTLVFTTIPGEVNESLKLEKLGAYGEFKSEPGKGYVYFATSKPKRIGYTLKNQGNVAQSPVGSITLRHMFGTETVINNINHNKSLALIGQTRTFTPCIKFMKEEIDFNGSRSEETTCADVNLWPGYYKVELNALYGLNGNNTKDVQGTASFWYLPWWFIAVFLAGLLFVGFHVWKFVRYIRGKRGGGNLRKSSLRRR